MAESTGKSYVPAAGKHWRLPFYDLMAKLLGADAARALFVEQAACGAGDRVLEIGCGTGSLLLLVKSSQAPAGAPNLAVQHCGVVRRPVTDRSWG